MISSTLDIDNKLYVDTNTAEGFVRTQSSPQPPEYQCPEIDQSKRQVLVVNMGSVRSFIYPTVHEYYYMNQVKALEDKGNQMHQIWYFSLNDVGRRQGFPVANRTHIQHLQRIYDVPVLEFYNTTIPNPPTNFERNPYNRNCTTMGTTENLFSGYAQAYHMQNAFKLAMEYAQQCNVEWKYFIRTRPDYICTSPLTLDFSQHQSYKSAYWNYH